MSLMQWQASLTKPVSPSNWWPAASATPLVPPRPSPGDELHLPAASLDPAGLSPGGLDTVPPAVTHRIVDCCGGSSWPASALTLQPGRRSGSGANPKYTSGHFRLLPSSSWWWTATSEQEGRIPPPGFRQRRSLSVYYSLAFKQYFKLVVIIDTNKDV